MAYRAKMSKHRSAHLFSRTAGARHVHSKNVTVGPMRGGIRL